MEVRQYEADFGRRYESAVFRRRQGRGDRVRQRPDDRSTATAASRFRCCRITTPTVGKAWLERGGVYMPGEHPRRRRVRPRLASGRAQGQPPARLRRFRARSPLISSIAASPKSGTSASWAAATAACSSARSPSSGRSFSRGRLPGAAHRHAAIQQARSRARAGWPNTATPTSPRTGRISRSMPPYQNVKPDATLPANTVHDLDPRRSSSSRPRPQNVRQDEGPGARRAVLRKHGRGPRRRGEQRAASTDHRDGVRVSVEDVAVNVSARREQGQRIL